MTPKRLQAALTAFHLDDPDRWMETASDCMRRIGLRYTVDRNRIRVWRNNHVESEKGYRFVDGWMLRRLWLGPREHALGVCTYRHYFREDGLIDSRPERVILCGGAGRRSKGDASLLSDTVRVVDVIQAAWPGRPKTVCSGDSGANLPRHAHAIIGSSTIPLHNFDPNTAYREHGFHFVPDGFGIRVCPVGRIAEGALEKFHSRIEKSLRQRGTAGSVSPVSMDAVSARVQEIERSPSGAKRKALALVFLLSCKRNHLDHSLLDLMARLDLIGVPYRRAYADDNFDFSIPDQLPSMLACAGGMPHAIDLSSIAGGVRLCYIGIDLSHKLNVGTSRLCTSLVGENGILLRAKVVVQRRDETPSPVSLERALGALREDVNEIAPDGIVVFRDGRLLENEHIDLYRKSLGCSVSIIEFRKGGNPHLYVQDGEPTLPATATVAWVGSGDTGFIVTNPRRKQKTMDTVLKLSWQSDWNELHLSKDVVANLICGLTHAPGLGLQRRTLPAPLYWSDGISGADDRDLRFRGQTGLLGAYCHAEPSILR